jgi:hypothetical protein
LAFSPYLIAVFLFHNSRFLIYYIYFFPHRHQHVITTFFFQKFFSFSLLFAIRYKHFSPFSQVFFPFLLFLSFNKLHIILKLYRL